MAWAALFTHKLSQLKYFQMQCIKRASTLRVSRKGDKSSPRIIYRYGGQDKEIQNFLSLRKMIKKIELKTG